MLSWQLIKHIAEYLTYKGRLNSSMNTTVVKVTEKSQMKFTMQVMT